MEDDYIEEIPLQNEIILFDIIIQENNVPKRNTIEYELSNQVKDISKEGKNTTKKDLPM